MKKFIALALAALMLLAVLAGCAQQALDRNINAATIRILQRHGCEVIVAEGAGCCGALPLHMGYEAQAKGLAAGRRVYDLTYRRVDAAQD